MMQSPLFLSHHGIKGQQWGVTHGPPYPIQPGAPVHIKKGTKLHRLSVYDESKSKGHAYVTYNKEDVNRYKGHFGTLLRLTKRKKVYMHDLEASEDLNSPSKKERINTFIDIYSKDKENVGKILSDYKQQTENPLLKFVPAKWLQKRYSDLKGNDLLKKGYNTFVKAIGGNQQLRNTYLSKLKKKGYNFVQDDQDSGNKGVEPGIVFNRKKSLKYKGKQEVTVKEMGRNLVKYGIHVKGKQRHREWE